MEIQTIFKKLIIVTSILIFGCEFRPSGYYLEEYEETTRCLHPIQQFQEYDYSEAFIINCVYNASKNVKQEIIYDGNTLEQIGLVTYHYKKTYYIKTIYDYIVGTSDNAYVIDRYYVNRN